MNLLTVSAISKRKDDGFTVKEISFHLQKFRKMAIAGETGSGKTTLLKIIAGLIQPDGGEVLLDNERVLGPEEKLIPGHKAVAFLSQQFELRNAYRVEEVLSYANHLPEEEAQHLYEVCRIDHLLKRRTDQLSGGERQRIAIARLLISAPKLLLLDEPYSNLDMIHTKILKSVLRDISTRLQLTCIMVSHSPLDTLSWADEILVMKDGRVVQQGSPEDVYRCPVDEYVGGLFGAYNLGEAFNGKRRFFRPEDVRLVAAGEGVPGTVTHVSFFGGYYELEVLVEGASMLVRTQESGVKGDMVHVAIAENCNWYI